MNIEKFLERRIEMNIEKFLETRTELEREFVRWYDKEFGEPYLNETDDMFALSSFHLLTMFYDAYRCENYNRHNCPKLQKRIDAFVDIVKRDKEGTYEYTSDDNDKVFGLIGELRL